MRDDEPQVGEPTPVLDGNHEPDFSGEFDADRAKRAIGNLRESERRLKAQLAELAPKAQELDALKQAQKTELERVGDQLTEERKQRVALERQLLRTRIGITKGVPAELHDRLQGETEDELMADADKLLSLVAPAAGVPRASAAQGAREPKPSGGGSMTERIRQAAGY